MSKDTKQYVKEAQKSIKEAASNARKAAKIFKEVGDNEGVKRAINVEKAADDCDKYVEDRCGERR